MKGFKFTPGPWEAQENNEYFPRVLIGPHLRYKDNSGNGFRAKLHVNEGPTPNDVKNGHGIGTTMETANANCRLIAAAPEMLELLIEISKGLKESHSDRIKEIIKKIKGAAR